MKAVIMAGGKGTRLFSVTNDEIPKPMVTLFDKPLLLHQITTLKENGIKEFILIIGHKSEKILDYFKDGKDFDVNITYITETQPLGSAGALFYLKNTIKEDFLLVYGDILFNIDIKRMLHFHKAKNSLATLFAHPNSHPYDSDLLIIDNQNKVINFDSKNNVRDYYYDNLVNAGIFIFSDKILDYISELKKTDLEKDILFPLVKSKGEIYAYVSPEYVKDIGTPERLLITENHIKSGLVESKNLQNKQKCIFLDRDGTINKLKGLIYKEEDFELEDFAAQAIKKINDLGFLAIVITNQPVVARGLCSIADVENIHKKLKTLLGKDGAFLDDVLFCPHHPDKGYPEENPVYKIDCECRKPKISLIEQCIKTYNIDKNNSYFIGDTTMDILTGKNASLKTILVLTGEAGQDKKYEAKPDFVFNNLSEAINDIEKRYKND